MALGIEQIDDFVATIHQKFSGEDRLAAQDISLPLQVVAEQGVRKHSASTLAEGRPVRLFRSTRSPYFQAKTQQKIDSRAPSGFSPPLDCSLVNELQKQDTLKSLP